MLRTVLIALRVAAVTLLLTGIVYPALITGAAQLLFPAAANGSLVEDQRGQVVGSELLAQKFTDAGYFHPRPSAAGAGYDAAGSGGSNLGPTARALRERAATELARLLAENPEAALPVPAELVTASGSGLDPQLSPAGALWQLPRVAKARGIDPARIRAVIDSRTEGRLLGLWGQPRINVLWLNLALDRQFGAPAPGLEAQHDP
jgi:K+-transporting ATPase ATPase C chain